MGEMDNCRRFIKPSYQKAICVSPYFEGVTSFMDQVRHLCDFQNTELDLKNQNGR